MNLENSTAWGSVDLGGANRFRLDTVVTDPEMKVIGKGAELEATRHDADGYCERGLRVN